MSDEATDVLFERTVQFADIVTNELGFAHFCGFSGDYEMTVKKGSDTVEKTISVTKSNPFQQIILD